MQHKHASPLDWPRTVPCAELSPTRLLPQSTLVQRHIMFADSHESRACGATWLVAVFAGEKPILARAQPEGTGLQSVKRLRGGQVALVTPGMDTHWVMPRWCDVVHIHMGNCAFETPIKGSSRARGLYVQEPGASLFQLVKLLLVQRSASELEHVIALLKSEIQRTINSHGDLQNLDASEPVRDAIEAARRLMTLNHARFPICCTWRPI